MAVSQQDLTVKGESIERVYGQYADRRLMVNRRYQRKLVWSIDEKINFIDSIRQGYPVPIVLFAERSSSDTNILEIIDGMQRLNAITSFIENDFAVGDKYFDLNTMAITKSLLDDGKLTQKKPKLDRKECVKIASYLLPVSIFEFSQAESVDEIFRRINSGGRKLSRQELRTAGATGEFAQTVRKISAKARGDDSFSDHLLLNDMKKISITSRDLDYGINVDSLFWIKNGILSKEEVRQSRDEEIVTDLIAYMVSSQPPASRTEYFDDYFGVVTDEPSSKRFDDIEIAIKKRSTELVTEDFQKVFDALQLLLKEANKSFAGLLFPGDGIARTPRYFQIVFLALHELLVKKNLQIGNYKLLVKKIANSGQHITIPEGGRWGSEHREREVESYAGLIQAQFKKSKQADPATVFWVNKLETLLSQSYTEQSSYDFKQGFLTLEATPKFDQESFIKILKTCVGIANISPSAKGYVVVGIADTKDTATRSEKIYKSKFIQLHNFYVLGIEREAEKQKKTLDQFFPELIAKIKSSAISDALKDHLVREIKLVRYYDKSVIVLDIEAQVDPSSYDDEYYVREGPSLVHLKKQQYPSLFKRFAT